MSRRIAMASGIRVLASGFQQILFKNQLLNHRLLSLKLLVNPALRSTLYTCSIRTSEYQVDKIDNVKESGIGIADRQNSKAINEDLGTSLVFNGVHYDDIPIAHIKATWNNTHIVVVDPTVTGAKNIVSKATCGSVGFKNAKKSTSVAAQTAAIAAATNAVEKGVKMVRVLVKGVGPGRQAAVKGIQMGGLEIISITDNTGVPHNGCRPRKARRL